MPDYFEHNAKRNNRKEVAIETVEFDMHAHPAGIEVVEVRFESTAECLAYIARETGRGP